MGVGFGRRPFHTSKDWFPASISSTWKLRRALWRRGSFTVIPYQAVRLEGVVLEKPLLIAELWGDEIVVRTLGFYAAYAKPSNSPQLIFRRRTDTNDQALLAEAGQAASDKARDLGWIE